MPTNSSRQDPTHSITPVEQTFVLSPCSRHIFIGEFPLYGIAAYIWNYSLCPKNHVPIDCYYFNYYFQLPFSSTFILLYNRVIRLCKLGIDNTQHPRVSSPSIHHNVVPIISVFQF